MEPEAADAPGPPDPLDRIDAYDYVLPPDRIASQPCSERDGSRLLVASAEVDRPTEHRHFHELGAVLAPGDLLVVNDARVIPARLEARRPSGARVEVLLHPTGSATPIPGRAFCGEALLRPSARIKRGEELHLASGLRLRVDDDPGPELRAVSSESSVENLLATGELPLPPYFDRSGPPTDLDHARYQTVFARSAGAIAAPTAGLHFSPPLLAALQAQGIGVASLTLFVGPGTFLPVRSERLSQHAMHEEAYEIPEATCRQIAETRARGGRVIAVGTTSTRALEASAALDGQAQPGFARTRLMIRPPYRFRVIDGLITNFHLPRSTLICLVAAFVGRQRILDLYREAVEHQYRFYSYGDAMLLWPSPESKPDRPESIG